MVSQQASSSTAILWKGETLIDLTRFTCKSVYKSIKWEARKRKYFSSRYDVLQVGVG